MIEFLLFASAAPDADAANLAYTQCLFAASRAASGERLPANAFEQRLASTCLAEQRNLENSLAKVLTAQGHSNAAAEARAVADNARKTVNDDYRRMIELEPEFRRLADMCKANPDQCRD